MEIALRIQDATDLAWAIRHPTQPVEPFIARHPYELWVDNEFDSAWSNIYLAKIEAFARQKGVDGLQRVIEVRLQGINGIPSAIWTEFDLLYVVR